MGNSGDMTKDLTLDFAAGSAKARLCVAGRQLLYQYCESRNVPHRRVVQFHLAGHTDCGTHRIDTHDGEVIDPVWELYRQAHRLTGGASTLLEWDAKIPPFPEVHADGENR